MNGEIELMVADCEARESKLNDWEAGFIDSLRNRLERGLGITSAQEEKLEQIWERVT